MRLEDLKPGTSLNGREAAAVATVVAVVPIADGSRLDRAIARDEMTTVARTRVKAILTTESRAQFAA